mgnify:CR=1 FL=1
MTKNNVMPFRQLLSIRKQKHELEALYILFCLMTFGQEMDHENQYYGQELSPLFVTKKMIFRIEDREPHIPYY